MGIRPAYLPLSIRLGEGWSTKSIKLCLLLVIVILLLLIGWRTRFAEDSEDSEDSLAVLSFQTPDSEIDYHTLINITFNFKRLPNVCNNLEAKFIVAVHTAPKNYMKRKALRETWGSWYDKTKVIFVIGDTQDDTLKKKLQKEIHEHQDFLQGDFHDSYQNLTYKHVMVLKYMTYHCPNVPYLLKVDDDAFVNMPNFLDFIDQYHQKYEGSTDILCNCLLSAKVMRKGKWAVSREYYGKKTYPPYCLGYSIVYPTQTATLLYRAAQNSTYFWIDDVHISGIIAHSVGIKHKNTAPLVINKSHNDAILKKKFSGDLKPFIFGTINVSPTHMRTLWNYVLKHMPKASIVDYIS